MKYFRCRLQRIKNGKPVYIREWVSETDASLDVVVRSQEGVLWKIVSIDRGTFVERVV